MNVFDEEMGPIDPNAPALQEQLRMILDSGVTLQEFRAYRQLMERGQAN